MPYWLTRLFSAACFVFFMAGAAGSAELSEPAGPILLTVTGDIEVTNSDGAALFDRNMLEAMPARTIKTSTIWTKGVNEFTGVPLDVLLDRLGVDGGELQARAINDYAVSIPVADAVENGPILAYAMDGEPMSVREKGPLWVVYPYDDVPEYQTEVIYSRSIWQLDRIEVSRSR